MFDLKINTFLQVEMYFFINIFFHTALIVSHLPLPIRDSPTPEDTPILDSPSTIMENEYDNGPSTTQPSSIVLVHDIEPLNGPSIVQPSLLDSEHEVAYNHDSSALRCST